MSGKTALITGVNGMDGSHLADFLLDKATPFMAWSEEPRNQTEPTRRTCRNENPFF